MYPFYQNKMSNLTFDLVLGVKKCILCLKMTKFQRIKKILKLPLTVWEYILLYSVLVQFHRNLVLLTLTFKVDDKTIMEIDFGEQI